MADTPSKWLRDLLVIPLVIGLLVAVFTYGLPKFLDKGKELSYSIDGPTAHLGTSSLSGITITVNGVPTSQLYGYRARIWNSGDLALKAVPVRFVFEDAPPGFRVFSVAHTTKPQFEFGTIKEESSDSLSRRFVYELLNPGNEDVVTFVANAAPSLVVFSNVEGVRLKRVDPQVPRDWKKYLSLATTLVAVLASFAGVLLKSISLRRAQ